MEMIKTTEKMNQLSEELRASRVKNSIGQMQPHFLYNALGSIREVILDNPQYASDLVYDFTTHLRACIKCMQNSDLIPFEQELTNINAYVNIEKMRFGEKLKIEHDIACDDFMIVLVTSLRLSLILRSKISRLFRLESNLWLRIQSVTESIKGEKLAVQ